MINQEIIDAMQAERARQLSLQHSGKFLYTCSDYQLSLSDKLTILTEEIGEVARAVLEATALTKTQGRSPSIVFVKKELIQVMAVCHAWLESL